MSGSQTELGPGMPGSTKAEGIHGSGEQAGRAPLSLAPREPQGRRETLTDS